MVKGARTGLQGSEMEAGNIPPNTPHTVVRTLNRIHQLRTSLKRQRHIDMGGQHKKEFEDAIERKVALMKAYGVEVPLNDKDLEDKMNNLALQYKIN